MSNFLSSNSLGAPQESQKECALITSAALTVLVQCAGFAHKSAWTFSLYGFDISLLLFGLADFPPADSPDPPIRAIVWKAIKNPDSSICASPSWSPHHLLQSTVVSSMGLNSSVPLPDGMPQRHSATGTQCPSWRSWPSGQRHPTVTKKENGDRAEDMKETPCEELWGSSNAMLIWQKLHKQGI